MLWYNLGFPRLYFISSLAFPTNIGTDTIVCHYTPILENPRIINIKTQYIRTHASAAVQAFDTVSPASFKHNAPSLNFPHPQDMPLCESHSVIDKHVQ